MSQDGYIQWRRPRPNNDNNDVPQQPSNIGPDDTNPNPVVPPTDQQQPQQSEQPQQPEQPGQNIDFEQTQQLDNSISDETAVYPTQDQFSDADAPQDFSYEQAGQIPTDADQNLQYQSAGDPNSYFEETSAEQPKKNHTATILVSAVALVVVVTIVLVVLLLHKPSPSSQLTPINPSVSPSATSSKRPSSSPSSSEAASDDNHSADSSQDSNDNEADRSRSREDSEARTAESKNQRAKQTLDDLVKTDRPNVEYNGHWIAQLASKAEGLEDPLDPPPSGGKAWTYDDILTQHMKLRKKYGSNVRLVLSTTYGTAQTTADGRPYYVTIYDSSFSDSDAVKRWCDAKFGNLPADIQANSCVPGRIRPA